MSTLCQKAAYVYIQYARKMFYLLEVEKKVAFVKPVSAFDKR